jgi:hypothetical protein
MRIIQKKSQALNEIDLLSIDKREDMTGGLSEMPYPTKIAIQFNNLDSNPLNSSHIPSY